MVMRYDIVELKAEKTSDGWIKDKPILTRSGIFNYRDANGKIVRELRPENEVFSDESMASLRGIPITLGHHGLIKSDSVAEIIGSIVSPGERQDNDLVAELVIHKPNKIGNRRELSCGYRCDIDHTPGDGYDVIQKNVRYNHVAIVEKGRAGNARLRLDSSDAVNGLFDQENEMEPKLVTVRLDEIDYQASPEVANALKKSQEAAVNLQKKFDTLEAERDELKTKLDEADRKIAQVQITSREEMKARLTLESLLGKQQIKFDENAPDIDLKKLVIAKLRPSIKLDGKSDDYINSAFDLAIEMDDDKNKKVANQKDKMQMHKQDDDGSASGSAESARAAMIKRLREGDKKAA